MIISTARNDGEWNTRDGAVRYWHVHYFCAKLTDLRAKLLMLETKTFDDEEKKLRGWRNENTSKTTL